eukprot:TRINITY_DN2543_c0_g1_i7.p1 TRINITY_DN2543_c0_g1~~TRINITY_DN2543_c0_g1_i7.p1  ORF type:complete len:1067 (-),score=230.40 TRINITY_DN2543_c0_g1_i7:63-3263(-)
MAETLTSPTIPKCTIFLVLGTVVCNFLVLLGNNWTAQAFADIGTSTSGWSKVGRGIALSLNEEIDETMDKVTGYLIQGLEKVAEVQEQLDLVLSLVGNETDSAIQNSTELSLLDTHGPEKGLALLQELHGKKSGDIEALTPLILKAVDAALEGVMVAVEKSLNDLLDAIKPALIQVGKWITQFGDTIITSLEEFSVTLDRAQKMFDQATEQLGPSGNNTDIMVYESWNLFDTDHTGSVDATDLRLVGQYYSITALAGEKAEQLVKKYDVDGTGAISKKEFVALVEDPSIKGSMSVILRKYARRLSEIAGRVGRAKGRHEVADATADYIRLVCAKNLTKVGWVADRLSNHSLVYDFVSSVLVELCLKNLDPNEPVYSTADSGELMVTTMYSYNAQNTITAVEYLANSSWWVEQGWDLQNQPACNKMATGWIVEAQRESLQQGGLGLMALGESFDSTEEHLALLEAMPDAAYILAEEGVMLHRLEQLQMRQQRRNSLFGTKTHQQLLARLTGGAAPSDSLGGFDAAALAVASSIPALPATREFARFLSYNASDKAQELNDDCATYTGDSSTQDDDFATKISGMVQKAISFIQMLEKYSTPKGIERLENQVQDFATSAIEDVKSSIEERLVGLIKKAAPALEDALHKAAHKAGEQLGEMIGDLITNTVTGALEAPVENILGGVTGGADVSAITDVLGEKLGEQISNLTAGTVGDAIGDTLEGFLDQGLEAAAKGLKSVTADIKKPSLLEVNSKIATDLSLDAAMNHHLDLLFSKERLNPHQHRRMLLAQTMSEEGVGVSISGVWTSMLNLLKSFNNLLPRATTTLKDAREEVTKLSAQLDNIFIIFEAKGPAIFDTVASVWRTIWLAYFLFLLPFSCFLLYYAFWANGWFGGPKPIPEDELPAPTNFQERCAMLCRSCCVCCQQFHDTTLCLWSVMILMQVLVLVTFIIAVALCIVAGVKAFLLAGCAQIYVLEDKSVCTTTLQLLKSFLNVLMIDGKKLLTTEDISSACSEYSLLTCELITAKMTQSTTVCTIFSFLASVFSLQMLFDSATLHEQAIFRRMAASDKKD